MTMLDRVADAIRCAFEEDVYAPWGALAELSESLKEGVK
jgi:hypothetical protein